MHQPANEFNPQEFIRHLTHQPGVYRMYDGQGEVIYVGKAKDLKKTCQQLFSQKPRLGKNSGFSESHCQN